jgi:hypothetical protein
MQRPAAILNDAAFDEVWMLIVDGIAIDKYVGGKEGLVAVNVVAVLVPRTPGIRHADRRVPALAYYESQSFSFIGIRSK